VIDPLELQAWRELFLDLRDCADDVSLDALLLPWVDGHRPLVDELHRIGDADSRLVRVPKSDAYSPLEALYALSRILDVLIAPHQRPVDDPALLNWSTGRPWWTGRLPTTGAYTQFCAALGCRRIVEAAFHPFLHEIVEVLPADDADEPPSLVDEQWPGFFVGSMLLARAGVTVRAGTKWLVPAAAGQSCLYWAWWRRNRQPVDMSHGWGHNSQWYTDFRRDYWADGQLYYNVDAAHRDARQRDDLNPDTARELLRYRHSTAIDHGVDQWVWDTHHVEPAPR